MSGSRFDSVETSGTAALLQQMLLRSSEFKTGTAKLAAKVHVHADREIQGVTLAVFNDQAQDAVDLLTRVFSRDQALNSTGFEAEKEILHRRGLEQQRDMMAQTFSNLYETSFEDHTMSLPLLGLRDNVPNLTLSDVEQHRDRTFIGSRMALVISGNPLNLQATMESAQTRLSSVPSEATLPGNSFNSVSLEKPLLTSTVMGVRDDEMTNLNVGVSYLTKKYGNDNHFFYQFFTELVGNYNANEEGSAHVNSSDRQYNLSHFYLGETPGVTLFDTKYNAFSDGGLFTNFIHGHEVWGNVMMYAGQYLNTRFTLQITSNEVFRARARVFNSLLQNSRVSVKNNLNIGKDLLYLNRRVGRNETARRISALAESTHVQKKAKTLFYDKDIALAAYGPQHLIDEKLYYGREMRKSTLASGLLPMYMA